MAESSIFWTTGSTGDGASAYTQAKCILWLHKTFCGADNEGVNKDVDNELVTTGATSPVATNTGEAYVRGFPYFNTASVDTAIPTPSSNTRIDRLVLRANWSAQTVRITRIAGTEGAGTPPAIVQTDGTTWDIPLYQVSITTGGAITLTDEREFLHPNIGVNTDMLDDDSVDDTKAGDRVPQFYRRQGGSDTDWTTQGTGTRTPGAVRIQAGTRMWGGSAASSGLLTITFPVAFSNPPIAFVSQFYSSPRAICFVVNPTATTLDIHWQDATGATYTELVFHWLAIGPE